MYRPQYFYLPKDGNVVMRLAYARGVSLHLKLGPTLPQNYATA